MSMRRVLTWKPSDEHPQCRKAKSQNRDPGVSASRGCRVENVTSYAAGIGKMLTLQIQSWNALIPSPRKFARRWTRHATRRSCTREGHVTKSCALLVRLAEAVCGLGHAPRSWWLSVHWFLTSMGGRGTRTDPTVW